MDNKLLLAKGITLLFRESQLPGTHENSASLVRELISGIKLPEVNVGVDHERDILSALKETALHMCDQPPSHQFETLEMIQRLKINTGEDVELFEAIREGIDRELDENANKRMCVNLKNTLHNHFRDLKVSEIIAKASYKLRFERDKITNMSQFVAEVNSQLEPYEIEAGRKDPAIVDEIDFSDAASVERVYQAVKDEETGATILRCGWQGINRMTRGGFRRGQEVVIGALQHKYKTGFSLSIFKQIALYNTPVLDDPTKKPMLVRISFEDDIQLNMQFLYQSLYENEHLKPVPDMNEMHPAEISSYVMEKLQATGWHIRMLRVDPSQWTYKDIHNKVLELEADGYEIHLLMLDYLSMIPTTGCTQGPMGTDVRDLFRRTRNFCSSKKIALITPHQLSTDAKQLIRDGRQDFVKEIAGKGYYSGSKQIDQEVDLELYIHIEIVNGKSWLTVQRGKHRLAGPQTPLADLYCVLPFEDVGGIRDDINGPDTTRKKVGGGPVGSADETPFWDFQDSL